MICGAVLLLAVGLGVGLYSGHTQNRLFQAVTWVGNQVAVTTAQVVGELNVDILYAAVENGDAALSTPLPNALAPGLILVAGIEAGPRNMVRVIDRQGRVVHEWHPDWFETWGASEGAFPPRRRPNAQPGALIHGIDILEDGDIVFNFEHLSTVRMTPCGEVVWKLDNLGHHSVHTAEDGTFWVSTERLYDELPGFYRHQTRRLRTWTVQHLAADGDVLREIDVVEILDRNDLQGLLRMSSLANENPEVGGDTLHLNDVEVFPSSLTPGVFEAGDIMLSLRNINTVLVVEPESLDIKYSETGRFLRQHDPDFASGDRISIYDNRNLGGPGGSGPQPRSRLLEIDARSGEVEILPLEARAQFFSAIMGTHQRLANGNMLINTSGEGRVIEVTPEGHLAWEYHNRIEKGRNGRITAAMVLPEAMDETFFADRRAGCPEADEEIQGAESGQTSP